MIRKANRNDVPGIYDLVKELAIFEKEPDAVVASLEEYYQNFDAKLIEALVLEVEGEIHGMALYYPTFSTWKGKMLYLEDFIVNEKVRNLGYGQKLFDAFLSEAKSLGCRMVKWQVLDWNDAALRFYKKNDAIIEKNWWNGKIILNKTIPAT